MITTNLLFFLETQISELEENCKKNISPFSPELKLNNKNILVKRKNGNSFLSKILSFTQKKNIGDLCSTDFYSENLFIEAFLNNYISYNNIDACIKIDNSCGYIMESIVSFPENSQFESIYHEEMEEKAFIYFGL